ncbi:MAG: hypothetical protein RIF32_18540, partial [Leptospirales bacterium]
MNCFSFNLTTPRRLTAFISRVILACGLVGALLIGNDPLRADFDELTGGANDAFLQFEASGAVIHYAAGLKAQASRIEEPIKRGLALIQSELESPGLPRAPHFWLVANDAELEALLKKRFPKMDPAVLKSAVSSRAYVKEDAFFLIYKPGIARQRLIRLVYNEFALLHLNMLAAGGPEKRVAWFHSGMAAYLAWISEAELNGTGMQAVEKRMIEYYGRNFDPAKARSLKRLEQPAAWAQAIRADHKGVYAQAALTWMYLVRRSSLSAGPLILRSMSTGESFADAFLNATDLRLGQFERDVREKFYPELRSAREAAAQAKARAIADSKSGPEARSRAEPEEPATGKSATAADEEPEADEPEADVDAPAKAKVGGDAEDKSEAKPKPEAESSSPVRDDRDERS